MRFIGQLLPLQLFILTLYIQIAHIPALSNPIQTSPIPSTVLCDIRRINPVLDFKVVGFVFLGVGSGFMIGAERRIGGCGAERAEEGAEEREDEEEE